MLELQGKYNTAKVFTDNVEATAQSQIIELCSQEFVKNSKIRIMPDCLTDDTEILTKQGFKLITDINLDDEVSNYNPLNKKISFSKPKNIINRPLKENEKIYEYYSNQQNFSFKVSENHRMAIKNQMGRVARLINDIKMSDMIFSGEGVENCFITNKYTNNDIRLICWIVGDGNIKITHNSQSDNYRIRFGLKKQRKIDRFITLLNEEHLIYSVSSSSKQTEIYINTECSKKYLDMVTLTKVFPTDFILFNKEQSQIFIDELILVDGDYESYINNRGYRISSIVKHNVDIISAIVSLNYGYSNINFKDSRLFYINAINNNSLQYSRSGLHNRIIKRREIEYHGNLVCVECDTSYFVARQNGLTFITGNCHAGAGCTIGTSMTIQDKVVPNIVGVDIGCGMLTIKLKQKEIDLVKLDKVIREHIPSGQNVRAKDHEYNKYVKIDNLKCKDHLNMDRARKSIGTLGGGERLPPCRLIAGSCKSRPNRETSEMIIPREVLCV